MSKKVGISNLKDFDNYRSICPFCSSPLKWLCVNSIIRSPQNFSQISIKEDRDHYVLTYDGVSSFSTLINSYIERIIINKTTNDITYDVRSNVPFPAEHIGSALQSNKITIHKQCDCVYEYHLISDAIDLTSIHNYSFTPAIFSESFCVDQQESNSFTKITMMYKYGKTKLSCFNLQNDFACTYEKDLPLLNLAWEDTDALLKKVQLLITFS